MIKKLTHLIFISIILQSAAQDTIPETKEITEIKISSLPEYRVGKGIRYLAKDSVMQVNFRFRMQNRATYHDGDGIAPGYSAEIRRLRLRMDGFVVNPKIMYAIQLSFAPGDVGEIQEGENINIIRDAVLYYKPTKYWSLMFGQTKLPGNRQRVNSSGALQLTDRSINNARFNIDRDFGFQAYYLHEDLHAFSYNIKTAVSTGEGRNSTKEPDNGLAYTGKFELLPFGAFLNDGIYFEGDLAREQKPKLMLSAAYQYNQKARKTQGQLGRYLFEKRDMTSLFLDLIFKYNGWAFQSAYMNRESKNPITYDPNDPAIKRFVFTGHGIDYQLSYLFPSHYEFIGRYSIQKVNKDIQMFEPHIDEYTIGVTKYIWEHTFKLQGELTYNRSHFANNVNKNSWYIRFQVEIGI